MKIRRVHYVLSSHWDREWYQAFQDYRYNLVKLLDHVSAGIADQRMRGPFQTDGQAIMLEDYLEIRPEKKGVIQQLVKQHKLKIGPWYVLPDEFLISGESMIRNLRLGRQIARDFGAEPSNAGFVCDLFGHISQLPQILKSFDIKAGFVWRGSNQIENSTLQWQGADESQIACYRFGIDGYCGFAAHVRQAGDHVNNVTYQKIVDAIRKFLAYESKRSEISPLIMFDGADHLGWDEDIYNHLFTAFENNEFPGYELVHSDLDTYLNELLQESDQIEATWKGEMREPGTLPIEQDSQWLIPGVASSRVWIKQANAKCESQLCVWAEPFSSIAEYLLQTPYPDGFLDHSWKWLIKNHPHDSICGCSIDQVHRDMAFRFSQSSQISNRITLEATQGIAGHIEGDVTDDRMRVVVFNASPHVFEGVTSLTLKIPVDWPGQLNHRNFEHEPIFYLEDFAGHELTYQTLAKKLKCTHTRLRYNKFPEAYKMHDVDVALSLKVPALGYTSFYIAKGDTANPFHGASGIPLATSDHGMSNAFLDVTVNRNGSLTLHDKQTDNTYNDLLTFEDSADMGDGWYHGNPVNDQVFTSAAASSDVAIIHNGPLQCTMRIYTRMRLPEHYDRLGEHRTVSHSTFEIVSDVTLRHDSKYLDIQTRIDNNIKDHRLRVLFPTDCKNDHYLADAPFDVVERSISLRPNRHREREIQIETNPQQQWTAVYDSRRSLSILSHGLYESAVCDLPHRPIALTLFRSTRRTVLTDGEPDGQLLQPLKFNYRILPGQGEPDRTHLFNLSRELAAGLRSVQLNAADQANWGSSQRTLPQETGFFRTSGAAVLTSVRTINDALEIRLFNPNETASKTEIIFDSAAPVQAILVNSESVEVTNVPAPVISGKRIILDFKPKQILTLRTILQF
ncbi:alpha-mannosidase [Poriferisphaera sp. WC338]|uniref:alpha-mannosidase n=1 Tax=Poriferisphaera sp. WC338 TaxID=3425129 RepID=UPI003D816FDA